MNTEDKTSGPSINTGGGEFSGDIVSGDQTKIAGDNVEGDKLQQTTTETHVAGDMHGDIKGGDIIQGDQEVTFETATQDLFDKLAANAPEIAEPRAIPDKEPVESPQQGDDSSVESEAPSVDAVVSDAELDAIDLNVEFNENEDHPKLVMASINKFAAAENPPSAEEQKGLFARAYSSIKKYATSDDAKAALDFVAGGIEVAAGGLPTPFNLIHYAAKKMSQ